MNAVTANGIVTYGEHIDQQRTYVPNSTYYVDTITLPTQDLIYSSSFTNLPLPCTYLSNFSATLQSNLQIQISFVGMSWVNAPGEIHRHYTIVDTVTGYGQMKIKYADGMVSNYIDVLQVKYNISEVDSSYVNGQALSLLQRDETGFVMYPDPLIGYMYFRQGDVTPLADIRFAGYNNYNITSARIHTASTTPSDVALIANTSAILVYPSPVSDLLTIDIPSTTATGHAGFRIVNVVGQEVYKGTFSNSREFVHTSNFSKGVYFLHIQFEDGRKETRKFVKE